MFRNIPSDSACTYEFLAVFYKLKEDVLKNFEVTPSSRALLVPRPKVPSTSLQGAQGFPEGIKLCRLSWICQLLAVVHFLCFIFNLPYFVIIQ